MTRKVSNCELSPSAGSGSAALKGALKRCQVVARAEYRVVSDAAEQAHQVCDEILGQLSKKRIKPRKGEKGKRLNSAVGTLAAEVEGQLIPLVAGAEKRLRAQYRQLSRFTVGLFGSTMAGKSTLREAVTGGDGSTIGKGAQNTTRRLQEYTWSGLRIVDTPGFGAHDSKAFTNQALRVLDKSDLVLFLCNSGLGIQESDFKMMAELVWENKPVVFVLNVKRDLEDDFTGDDS